MTALQALSDALDAAHRRERGRLNEIAELRSDVARLERAYEKAHRDLAAMARLVDELGGRPVSEVAA